MRLVWIRHGETDINTKGRYLGHFDAPLNETGKRQAQQVAEQLIASLTVTHPVSILPESSVEVTKSDANVPFLIYSSDLSRCVQTAQIIWQSLSERRGVTTEKVVPPIPSNALRELDFGEWDCRTYTEIDATDPIRLRAWYQDPFIISPPNGETLYELDQRLHRWLTDTLSTVFDHQTIIVVSHGGPIRWFQSVQVDRDAHRFWEVKPISHGGMYVVDQKSNDWIESRL